MPFWFPEERCVQSWAGRIRREKGVLIHLSKDLSPLNDGQRLGGDQRVVKDITSAPVTEILDIAQGEIGSNEF